LRHLSVETLCKFISLSVVLLPPGYLTLIWGRVGGDEASPAPTMNKVFCFSDGIGCRKSNERSDLEIYNSQDGETQGFDQEKKNKPSTKTE
jgi:hypothetical protein